VTGRHYPYVTGHLLDHGMSIVALPVMGRDISGFTLGNGDVVLLLHGWGGAATDMSSLADAVADAGYQAVVPNLPGHRVGAGVSPKIPDQSSSSSGSASSIRFKRR
jgi:pimeloyl-ACP methyl ester carboxylesterase